MRLNLGVADPAGDAQTAGKIVGPDENGIDARHRQDRCDPAGPLDMLDLDDHGNPLVGAVDIAIEGATIAVGAATTNTAAALGRVPGPGHHPAGFFGRVDQRRNDAVRSGVQRPFDPDLFQRRYAHQAGAALLGRPQDGGDGLDAHRAMLTVDEQPVVADVGQHLGHGRTRQCEHRADQGRALAQHLSKRSVGKHRGGPLLNYSWGITCGGARPPHRSGT